MTVGAFLALVAAVVLGFAIALIASIILAVAHARQMVSEGAPITAVLPQKISGRRPILSQKAVLHRTKARRYLLVVLILSAIQLAVRLAWTALESGR
ncbi:hypothetical protein [Phenylobacterium conjunctum]|uniref:Uncharacterized protein n=1 Tax=Phenylobacterium conjunctum TaxID=1298959 RepID=A0ABW3T3K0_9CAUL